ncbi:MAG: regulator [Bacteroidota bacterium]
MNKILLLGSIVFLLLSACKNESEQKAEIESSTYSDVPFTQEYHEGYSISKEVADANDVRAIKLNDRKDIWVATKDGVYKKLNNEKEFTLVISGDSRGPAYDVDFDQNGKVWIATWNGIYSDLNGPLSKMEGPEPPLAKVVIASEGVYALGPGGIWLYAGDQWTKKEYTKARSMRDAISDGNGGLWIGTDVGLYHCNETTTQVYNDNEDLICAYVRGVDYDDNGNLWVGVLGGVTIRDNQVAISHKRPENGIANAEVNVVRKAPDGKMWVGTQYGISRFTPGEEAYSVRHSRRWLMSDEVRDITFDTDGNAWIATANGVSAIMGRQMTLSEKAEYFYHQMITRHVREPWIVGSAKLEVPGDTSTIVADDDDNDGEYTSMYLAMESFRYAVTGSSEAKERAKKAFDFLHLLREVTDMDGFFARTIVPADWEVMHDMNRTYTPQEEADELINNPRHKPVEVRWHLSKDGKWKWKGDTSSDELDGHFFGYYWYYYLVADEIEKQRVADHVGKIMDHLIRNDFYLVDVDGTHTKWGVWSPQSLNEDPEWSPEKPLNSLEILSFLKFVYEITQDEKYQQSYLKLINVEGYLENAKSLYTTNPAWETYFDIYLALYIYPALINLEKDPALKEEYVNHMDQWFEKFKETQSPLLNFTYNILTDGSDELDASISFLKDAPLDLVDWQIDNGSREDLQKVRYPILEEVQVNELRPPSEYRTIRWDKNPYYAVAGNPFQEREPVYWLLPYWMGRYQSLIK